MQWRWLTILCTALMVVAVAGAATFSGNLLVRPDWTHKSTGITVVEETFGTLYNWTFTSGTTNNQMNALWRSRRTLAASGVETLNLAGGITNAFGDALSITNLKMIVVVAGSTNTTDIVLGGASTQALVGWVEDASDKVRVKPHGFMLVVAPDAAGYDVSTNSYLTVSNAGAAEAKYDIYLGGESE